MGVLEFLCNSRFHQSFVLPPNPSTGRNNPYRVSYADFGDPKSNAVVLFCGEMFSTRFTHAALDQLARANSVRIVHADRPGIGGSDPVKLDKRVEIWLEIVPKLLAHLNVEYVSLASASGGDVYMLNVLLAYPQLLHPETPYVCFFAPWVHHSHTKMPQIQATDLLPAPLIGKYASIARFNNDHIEPLSRRKRRLIRHLKTWSLRSYLQPASASVTNTQTDQRTLSLIPQEENESLWLDDPYTAWELYNLITAFTFAESLHGHSADVQLLLKRPRSTPWCAPSTPWTDFNDAVSLFSSMIERESTSQAKSRHWVVDAFHAEDDIMVGVKGRLWFDSCWTSNLDPAVYDTAEIARSTSLLARGYEYRAEIVRGAEHCDIMEQSFGVVEKWLRRVRESVPLPVEVCSGSWAPFILRRDSVLTCRYQKQVESRSGMPSLSTAKPNIKTRVKLQLLASRFKHHVRIVVFKLRLRSTSSENTLVEVSSQEKGRHLDIKHAIHQ